MPPQLDAVVQTLTSGRVAEPVTVRTFLEWFGAYRRGWRVVQEIRQQLDAARLVTVPDFESRWIDSPIGFSFRDNNAVEPTDTAPEHTTDFDEAPKSSVLDDIAAPPWISRDPTYRLSKLEAATKGVETVSPDAPLSMATTIMLARDFSQIPVMSNAREVKGVISWQSLGSRLALGQIVTKVQDAMERVHHEVRVDTSIFEAIPLIVQAGYVLVRGSNNVITGIVTASDLSSQFRLLTEPFLLLSEIENLVRNLVGERFTVSQLGEARDPSDVNREIKSVSDLTLGEYIRLLENPQRWSQLETLIDRNLFCKSLDRVRAIRNEVMHFDPDGIRPADLEALRDFARFLKSLEIIRRATNPSH